MVFSYYNRLSSADKRVYRRSDQIAAVVLPGAAERRPLVLALAEVLKRENRADTEALCQKLATAVTASLKVPLIRVKVLASRPKGSWGELHGLYEPSRGKTAATITVWMRTAEKRKVVAFRSFLRTLLHEICHHLDYELFSLPESFHTEGFYKRESSLFHQLVGMEAEKPKEKPL